MICQHYRNIRSFVAPFAIVAILFATGSAAARADRIVLRSLQIISDRTVVSFDDDGIVLDNQQRLAWHDVEKATISPTMQPAFDKLLGELGGSLYRIRQRLTTADYEGLLQPAESLYPRFAKSTSDTGYLVKQSVMWGRIAAGRREEAVESYLACWELLAARKAAASTLPGDRRLRLDIATGLTPELLPVWFNVEAAKRALPAVFRRIGDMPKPRPDGAYIYYATLALAAGNDAEATKGLAAIKSDKPAIVEMKAILDAQRELNAGKPAVSHAKLELMLKQMSLENQPLAWYWLGIGKLQNPELAARQDGLLQLLRIPALAGPQQPELAAAALYRAMETLMTQGDASGSVSVRRELLERYGQSYYAIKLRESTAIEKSP